MFGSFEHVQSFVKLLTHLDQLFTHLDKNSSFILSGTWRRPLSFPWDELRPAQGELPLSVLQLLFHQSFLYVQIWRETVPVEYGWKHYTLTLLASLIIIIIIIVVVVVVVVVVDVNVVVFINSIVIFVIVIVIIINIIINESFWLMK